MRTRTIKKNIPFWHIHPFFSAHFPPSKKCFHSPSPCEGVVLLIDVSHADVYLFYSSLDDNCFNVPPPPSELRHSKVLYYSLRNTCVTTCHNLFALFKSWQNTTSLPPFALFKWKVYFFFILITICLSFHQIFPPIFHISFFCWSR